MAYLVLVRHGQSEWNALGIWTGQQDPLLTDKGRQEARHAAGPLADIEFDHGFASDLHRAQDTLSEILDTLGQADIPVDYDKALSERDYGDLTGKNKWDVKAEFGVEKFNLWRRSWNYPVPNGETLKDVYARVSPYYDQQILPLLKSGQNVIVAASGNSLRALVKHLEDIANDDIAQLEIGTGEVYCYKVASSGHIESKEIKVVGGKA